VLARLLVPADYGLMGMAIVVTNFANMFRDLGTSAALIQRKDISDELVSTLLWTNLAIGAVLACAVIGAAFPARWYFKEPRVVPLLCALAPTFILAGLSTVQQALIQRALQFSLLARVEVQSTAFSVAVGISAAVAGYGVWSLIAQTLAGGVASAVLLWTLSAWRPRWHFSLAQLRSVLHYGLNLTAFSTLNYFLRNADSLLIGRRLGTQSLGYYSMAYKIMLYPLNTISSSVGRALFPAFSRLQEDDTTFQRGYLRAIGFISLITFPLLMGLMAVARPAVATMLSAKWLPIVPLLFVLCPLGMVQSVGATVGLVFTARGRTDILFRVGGCCAVATVVAFVAGLSWGGVLGLCIAYLAIELLETPFCFYFACRQIKMPMAALLRPLRGPLLCSTLMAVIVNLSYSPIASVLGPRVGLVAGVAEGVGLYLLLNGILNRSQARDFLHTLLPRFWP
jgi:PST family polysaccharide transporter